ncbi:MAG: L-seryl-tRNA(Sec) selenium transferase [Deltaproteobacteria bacterium]|nr:L-seryl-tRNA(Sec) selenium transferase [Deltaproteobacteria bacterium]
MNELFRKIPKVDTILNNSEWVRISSLYPSGVLRMCLNEVLEEIREDIRNNKCILVPTVEEIIEKTKLKMDVYLSPSLKRVINATGIIVHTNLGRSLLSKNAVEAIINVSFHYTNLEYDIRAGQRGERYVHCSEVLKKLTGMEDAIVVNNNAAAVYLVLNTLAQDKEVIISRGELVEIGGSFRIPDVMKKSGAILREVGTTNRTYLRDYEEAISPNTALIMKVHTSNFVIKGFTEETKIDDLLSLAKSHGIPFYFDTGSGLFLSGGLFLNTNEPNIIRETKKDIDIISFSGDKLLGGPQAGIILGKTKYIEQMKKNPLIRALRPDKMTLAALEATLLLYLEEENAKKRIPTLRMALLSVKYLKRRTNRILRKIKKECEGLDIMPHSLYSEVGGGSLPEVRIPSYGFSIRPKKLSVSMFEQKMRELDIPIIARIEKERIMFDMRTILEEDEKSLIFGITQVYKKYETDG